MVQIICLALLFYVNTHPLYASSVLCSVPVECGASVHNCLKSVWSHAINIASHFILKFICWIVWEQKGNFPKIMWKVLLELLTQVIRHILLLSDT